MRWEWNVLGIGLGMVPLNLVKGRVVFEKVVELTWQADFALIMHISQSGSLKIIQFSFSRTVVK